MLEQFRQYEIKDTRNIFGRQDLVYGDEPDVENQFTLDCPPAPSPIHSTTSMAHCLPAGPDHTNPASAD